MTRLIFFARPLTAIEKDDIDGCDGCAVGILRIGLSSKANSSWLTRFGHSSRTDCALLANRCLSVLRTVGVVLDGSSDSSICEFALGRAEDFFGLSVGLLTLLYHCQVDRSFCLSNEAFIERVYLSFSLRSQNSYRTTQLLTFPNEQTHPRNGRTQSNQQGTARQRRNAIVSAGETSLRKCVT